MRLSSRITIVVALAAATTASADEPSPGEAYTYSFSLGEIEGGRARMAIGVPIRKGDRNVIGLRAQAETSPWLRAIAPLNDEYQLIATADDQLPIDVDTKETGKRVRTSHTHYDPGNRRADVKVSGERHSTLGSRNLPTVVRDPLSIYLHLRRLPLKNGDALIEHMLDRSYLTYMTFKVVERENLILDAAHLKARAIKIEGVGQRIDDAGHPLPMPPRPFTFWLSDDRDRILLRVEADVDMGRARVELTSYAKTGTP